MIDSTKEYVDHSKSQTSPPYSKCKLCSKYFCSIASLERHEHQHRSQQQLQQQQHRSETISPEIPSNVIYSSTNSDISLTAPPDDQEGGGGGGGGGGGEKKTTDQKDQEILM